MISKLSKDAAASVLVKQLQGKCEGVKKFANIGAHVMDNGNARIPVEINEETKTITIISDERLETIIKESAKHLSSSLWLNNRYQNVSSLDDITYAQLKNAANLWLVDKDSELDKPVKPFAFKNEDCYAFSRIKFDLKDEISQAPTWSDLLSNFTNKNPIMAFIGSLFFMESYKQQYLWIYGKGGNGKGAIIRAIHKVFGNSYISEVVPRQDDKYWTSGLIGKRVVVFDDCEHYSFPKSGLFKTLTGGNRVRVESKYKNQHDVEMECKYIFCSNQLPKISSEKADQRRVILSTTIKEFDFDWCGEFEKSLEKELPEFISNCVLMYKDLCPKHGPIPTDVTKSKELGIVHDDEFWTFFENFFELDEENKGFTLPAQQMNNIINKYAPKDFSKHYFYQFLDRIGVKRDGLIRDKETKVPSRIFNGLRIKPPLTYSDLVTHCNKSYYDNKDQ